MANLSEQAGGDQPVSMGRAGRAWVASREEKEVLLAEC